MRSVVVCAVFLAACGSKKASHPQIHVAAAADLARAFAEVGPAFQKKTGIEPIFTFGSTGLLTKQIEQGAPFDLLAAANVEYADQLIKAGDCDGATKTMYARGRLVVWTPQSIAAPASLADLADPRFAKISIANPEHAPYGVAARMAMQKAGVWNAVEPRMVYGENVQQALQFAQSGNADAAVIALSLSTVTDGGHALPIDPSMHDPIDQALVVCKNGGNAGGAKQFADFVASKEGREIMTRYGFVLPGEAGAPAKGAVNAPPPIPESEARGLVAQWLGAQNTGNADAYGALYASKFTGIKRVGYRTWRFAREAWLADRKKMFKRPMKVGADDVRVRVAGPVAIVDLVQSFEQGAFKDRGPKQLLVVRTPDGLRIGREEMLASHAEHGDARAAQIGFVVEVDGVQYAILAEETDAPGTGAPTPVRGTSPLYSFEPIDPSKAPPEVLAWKGKSVRVYPKTGASCDGTLEALVRVAVATPHFGTLAEWNGQDGAAPLTESARAKALADLAPVKLAAVLDTGCTGDWVDLGNGKDGLVFAESEPDAPLAKTIDDALRALPGWKQIQTDFEQSYAGKGAWIDADGGVIETHVFASPDGKTRYAAAHAHAGSGCGDFEGELTALWLVDAHGALTAIGNAGDVPFPRAITDVDRDGAIELLTDTDVFVPSGGGFTSARHLDLHDMDCPC
ncbi:MAG TPA: molybdate ABC transporter substrate-binding protein, partial [Kofleriaceae bacterium]|nr:molybdate ABC transporter substrate-binding protein [Kofleriaceae bacterium]